MSLAVVLCALTTIAELLETLKTSKGGSMPRTRPSGDEFHPYVAPKAGDSRSPCPAMNALANHGYLYVFILSVFFSRVIDVGFVLCVTD